MFRRKRLQNRITAGHWTLPAAILIALLCWGTSWFVLPKQTVSVASILFYAAIGYLLVLLNNTFALIRMRASVQTAVYLLLTAACPLLHSQWSNDITALFFLLSIFFLLRSYQQAVPMGDVFHSFLFMGLGSLFMPQLTWLAPFYWLGAYRFPSLNLKSFFASLMGWALPYWFLLAYAYWQGQMEMFFAPLQGLLHFHPLCQGYTPSLMATGGYLLLLVVVSSVHCIAAGYEDKLRTRSYLNFLVTLNLVLCLWLILQPAQGEALLTLLLPIASILAGHLFVLTGSRSSNLFFLIMLILLIPLFLFNLWMLL